MMIDQKKAMEEVYEKENMPRYPYESVVSFVFRYAPPNIPRKNIRILEVGFGSGNNLWFAAREGFSVAGVEISDKAVAFARQRFKEEGLHGDLRIGDFTKLPFENESFDLAIDRGALTCVDKKSHIEAILEIQRVLKKGGKFHYNSLSDAHSAYRTAKEKNIDFARGITSKRLHPYENLLFSSRKELDQYFGAGWNVLELWHDMKIGMLEEIDDIVAFWIVIAEKT